MRIERVTGDLLDQPADAIVNAWNRNLLPWWLLVPQGVSGAIKRRAGTAPFREMGACRPIPLGSAVHTGAGRLPYAGMIHVAGIDLLWRASERSIRDSVRSAVKLAEERGYGTIAMPIVGAGSGSFDEDAAEALILDTAAAIDSPVRLILVRYPTRAARPGAKQVLMLVMAVFMCVVGVLHFVRPDPFVQIMPSALAEYALALVYVSGFFEIAGGVGLLVPPLRKAAAWGLVALFIAVFPANINMAVNEIAVDGHALPTWALWARLPFQAVLVGLAVWFARDD